MGDLPLLVSARMPSFSMYLPAVAARCYGQYGKGNSMCGAVWATGGLLGHRAGSRAACVCGACPCASVAEKFRLQILTGILARVLRLPVLQCVRCCLRCNMCAGRAQAAQRAAGEGRAADTLAAGGLRASACPALAFLLSIVGEMPDIYLYRFRKRCCRHMEPGRSWAIYQEDAKAHGFTP